MGNTLVSIDLGSKNIHLVTGSYRKGNLDVKQAFVMPTPEGVIKDGKVENLHILIGVLKSMLAENKIKCKNAVLTIQSTSIITREITLPTVKQSELENMVRFEIEQYLPIVSNEYIIEYTFIDEVKEDNINKSRIQVAAMPKQMVDNYLNLIKETGLKPIALDIHTNTVAKIFAQLMDINFNTYTMDRTIAFIDLGHNSINIHIVSKGKLVFSRIITLGAKELDTEISISFNMTIEQAELKKINDTDLDNSDYANVDFNDVIRSKLDSWLSEIQKIFQYYISRTTGNRIDGIYLFGGSSKIKGLARYTEQALNIKTSKINSLSLIKGTKKLPDFDQGDYINALGGLIRHE